MYWFQSKFFFIFICFSQLSVAQLPSNFIAASQSVSLPFTITSFGTKHGLPQNQILSIVPKKDGELIISTANGIVEYNGTDFYSIIENEDYKKKLHYHIFWHEKTQQIFGDIHTGSFNRISPILQTVNDLVTATIINDSIIGINSAGDIKTGSVSNLVLKTRFKTQLKNVESLYCSQSEILLANSDGVFRYVIKTNVLTKISSKKIYEIRKNLFSDKIFLYSNTELFLLTNNYTLQQIDLKTDTKEHYFTSLEFINENEFFLGGSRGLFHSNKNNVVLYTKENALPTDYIQSLYYNKPENCLFVGTGNKGLLKLKFKSISHIQNEQKHIENSMSSIIQNHEGKVLAAIINNYVFQIEKNKSSIYLYINKPIASLSEIDKRLYIGSWGGGAEIYDGLKKTDSIMYPQINSNNVHSVFQDSRKRIWIGNSKGVSVGYSKNEIAPLLPLTVKGRIITIYELKNGAICLGGENGVYILDKNNTLLVKLDNKNNFNVKEVRSFYEDAEGKLWIAAYGGGLFCYHKNVLTSINNKPNSQLNIDVFTLAKGNNGYLYMTSNTGLFAINETKLNEFYYNKINFLVPFFYGVEDGIPNIEFNGGFQNNYLKTQQGNFYFPTIEGVVFFNTDQSVFRKQLPKIKKIVINETEIKNKQSVFERTTHSVEFKFYCTSYNSNHNIYYQTKLTGTGLPNTWNILQKNNSIRYSMLPPGEYVFSVRGIDGFNEKNPPVAIYSFKIKPYFYETWWFYLLVSLIILFGVFLFIKFRIYQTKLKERKNNNVNNTILELKLKAIQSKMNPHFIFNSLNNIVYMLNTQKYQEAETLVEDFSLLLRQFLENSDQTFSTLKNELAIIDLYLAIEKRRYNGLFDYEINMDSSVEHKSIPTLLIQPFVENAVKHGISHSEKKCLLSVSVLSNAKGVKIIIKDNGVGRKRSSEINVGRTNHTSKGIQLVLDKIEVVRLKYKLSIELDMLDNNEPNQTGTIIHLKIPYYD